MASLKVQKKISSPKKLKVSILFIEDEEETRLGIANMILRRVEKLHIASNATEAIQMFKEHKPDLVLTDIQMKGQNGLQILEEIKDINPQVKTVVMTAYTETDYLLKAIELQVDGYIIKPIRKTKLLATINKQAQIILQEEKIQKQEFDLKNNEQKYRLLTESLNDVVVRISPTGKRLYVSPSIKNFLGYNAGLMDGDNIFDFFAYEEDKTNALKVMAQIPKAKTSGVFEFWYKPMNKKKKIFPVEVSYNPLFIDEKLESIQLVMRDITERKEATETINKHAESLQKHNEDLDAFSHTVAHDLKNPLGTILSFANFLDDEYNNLSPEEIQKYLKIILRNGKKSQQIIDSLLIFASVRKADIEVSSIDMTSIVEEAKIRLKPLIEKKNAKIKCATQLPKCYGQENWVEEVWVNYLSNALKYGGTPPQIEIGGELAEHKTTKKPMVRYWIKDNGRGISAAQQKLLFKQFERLEQVKTEGHGLGLSIVQRIIEKLGGEVCLKSEKGKGSCFYFSLPSV